MNAPDYIKPEELLRILFDSPNATAVYKGNDITILSANAAMLSLWGKDRSIVGKPLEEAIPEYAGQPFLNILQEVWKSGKVYLARDNAASLVVDGQLQLFYFDFEYKPILDDSGRTIYILHTAVEVSERMAAQKTALEKSIREQQLSKELMAVNEGYQSANEGLAALNEEYQTANEHLAILNEKYQANNKALHRFQAELQKLNNNLTESENRFRVMIEKSPVAMASLKGEKLILDVVNEKMLEIWGQNPSVIGKPLSAALTGLNHQHYLDMLYRVHKSGAPFHIKEFKASISRNGCISDYYMNFVYQPIRGLDGEISEILIVANDVTDLVNSRTLADEFNTRLQIALDASKLGSTEVELRTGKMKSDDQFKRNFGFLPEEEFSYGDLLNAIFPDHLNRIKALVQEAITTNGIYYAEYPVRWKDGSVHWIKAHGRPRYDEDGKPNRMVGMTVDITKEKLFEQRKDDFLSIASHELKTPVTSLKASAQLLARMKDKPFTELHDKLIAQISKSVKKMSILVDELLNVNRMSEGHLQLEYTKFNLYDMLSNSCNHVRLEGIYELKLIGEPNLIVYADEHRIDQVVVNFVNNAVKYAPDVKEIQILVEKEQQFVKVSVKDFGPGIAGHILPNLFDRYYRVDHSGKTYTGLGLGLYICSEIIKKHGGEIGAESEIGQGSTFWFTIPI